MINEEDKPNESKLEWVNWNGSINCLIDLEIGNVYRDGHEAKSDFYRLKNIMLQKQKQINEKINKEQIEEDE
jgi:hypothetical protein